MSPADDTPPAPGARSSDPTAAVGGRDRLAAVTLDQGSIGHGNHHIEHEREVAILDLIDGNTFAVVGRDEGPYTLRLSIEDERLMLAVGTAAGPEVMVHPLSLGPFKRIVRDYFVVCDTYYDAIRSAPPSRIQAIDLSRRGLHDDASRLLIERLADKITVDFDTARRLFTLIAALHWKG
jgi:uncharacterized protein (UPF0262 family)